MLKLSRISTGAADAAVVALAAVVIFFGADVAANVQQALPPSRVEEGRVIFAQVCRFCHSNEPDRHKNGPSLFAVVGRAAGSAPDFEYSDAMKGAGLVWDDESLDRYLADTKHFIPGNRMPYSFLIGTQNQQRRESIIAYLHALQ